MDELTSAGLRQEDSQKQQEWMNFYYPTYDSLRARLKKGDIKNLNNEQITRYKEFIKKAIEFAPDSSKEQIRREMSPYGLNPEATGTETGAKSVAPKQVPAKQAPAKQVLNKYAPAKQASAKKEEIPTIVNTPKAEWASGPSEPAQGTSSSPSKPSSLYNYDKEDLSLDTIMSLYTNIVKMQESPGADKFMLGKMSEDLAKRLAAREPGMGMSEEEIAARNLSPLAAMTARYQRADYLQSNLQSAFDRLHTPKPEWWDRVKQMPVATQNMIYSNYNPKTGGWGAEQLTQGDKQSLATQTQALQKTHPGMVNPWASYLPAASQHQPTMSGMPVPYQQQPLVPQLQPQVPVTAYQQTPAYQQTTQAPSHQQYGNLSPGGDMSDRFGYNAIIHQMAQQPNISQG